MNYTMWNTGGCQLEEGVLPANLLSGVCRRSKLGLKAHRFHESRKRPSEGSQRLNLGAASQPALHAVKPHQRIAPLQVGRSEGDGSYPDVSRVATLVRVPVAALAFARLKTPISGARLCQAAVPELGRAEHHVSLNVNFSTPDTLIG